MLVAVKSHFKIFFNSRRLILCWIRFGGYCGAWFTNNNIFNYSGVNNPSDTKYNITIKNLLTMTERIHCQGPCAADMYSSSDPVKYFFDQPISYNDVFYLEGTTSSIIDKIIEKESDNIQSTS